MPSAEENTRSSDWSEQQLVTGIAAGNPAARTAFVSASHDAVFSFACRLAPDEYLRQDWTHDCLLRIIADMETGTFQFRHEGGFWSWFRKRSWFLLLEARRRHRHRSARETQTGETFPDLSDSSNPLHDMENAEIVTAVERCLDGITHQGHREALRLLLLYDYSYLETAETMDTPLNTVRSWIRIGRLALRRCLSRRLGIRIDEDGK